MDFGKILNKELVLDTLSFPQILAPLENTSLLATSHLFDLNSFPFPKESIVVSCKRKEPVSKAVKLIAPKNKIVKSTKSSPNEKFRETVDSAVSILQTQEIKTNMFDEILKRPSWYTEFWNTVFLHLTKEEGIKLMRRYSNSCWSTTCEFVYQRTFFGDKFINDMIDKSGIDRKILSTKENSSIDDLKCKMIDILYDRDIMDLRERREKNPSAKFIDTFNKIRDEVSFDYITPQLFFRLTCISLTKEHFIKTVSQERYDEIMAKFQKKFMIEKVIQDRVLQKLLSK